MLSADRALAVAPEFEFPEFQVERVEKEQAVQKGEALAQDEFEDFGGLDEADDAGNDAEDAGLGATGREPGRGWFWKKTAVAGAAQVRGQDAGLALEAEDGAVDVGFLEEHAGIVDQVAGREIVAAIGHEVVGSNEFEGIPAGQAGGVQEDFDVRIEAGEGVAGRFGLGAAEVRGAMKDLALKIGEVHLVEIHQAQLADTGRRQVEGDGGAEATGAEAKDAGGANFLLAFEADFGQAEVTRVTAQFVIVEFHNQSSAGRAGGAKRIRQAGAKGNDEAQREHGSRRASKLDHCSAKGRGEAAEVIGAAADAGDGAGQRL